MKKKYPSKVSYGLLLLIFLIFYGPIITVLIRKGFDNDILLQILFFMVLFLLILYLFISIHYIIDRNELSIKIGFLSYASIDIDQITSISNSKNLTASPAASIDRIKITYGKYDEVIISPKDKLNFAAQLSKLNPNIEVNLLE